METEPLQLQNPVPVNIIGAGFSGMVLAYQLAEQGVLATVYEKDHSGGLIQTHDFPEMQVETAANGFLWSPALQHMCNEIGVELQKARAAAKKRFIWRDRMEVWPLGLSSTLKLAFKFFPLYLVKKSLLAPKKLESIEQWCLRVLNREILDWLVAPALQGIYAGDPSKLSASLILKHFFRTDPKPPLPTYLRDVKPKFRGTVAPLHGMGEFFKKMEIYLQKKGVTFVKKDVSPQFVEELLRRDEKVVVATNPMDAAKLTHHLLPVLSKKISSLNILSTLRVTIAFGSPAAVINGFGVLFPRNQGFTALGVLANTSIFTHRGNHWNESWIMGGANAPSNLADLPDTEVLNLVLKDREKLLGVSDSPSRFHVTRWPKAFVHYDLNLEESLPLTFLGSPWEGKAFLTGNYLGSLGLSKMLDKSAKLANRIVNLISTERDL